MFSSLYDIIRKNKRIVIPYAMGIAIMAGPFISSFPSSKDIERVNKIDREFGQVYKFTGIDLSKGADKDSLLTRIDKMLAERDSLESLDSYAIEERRSKGRERIGDYLIIGGGVICTGSLVYGLKKRKFPK